MGAIFDNLDDVQELKVAWEGNRNPLRLPLVASLRVAHVWDNRVDNNPAARRLRPGARAAVHLGVLGELGIESA